MHSYSQNGEDLIIVEYFKGIPGNLLSIGENDGETLSNSRLLIENGWGGILVEPDLLVFKKLWMLYPNNVPNVWIFNAAISDHNGEGEFYSSGSHLTEKDSGLLSTFFKKSMDKWFGTGTKFNSYKAPIWTFDYMQSAALNTGRSNRYDYITIDAEDCDILILKQINLQAVGCKCLCIEWNGIEEAKKEMTDYVSQFGMKLHHQNGENLIFVI